MGRARDIASLLTTSSVLATDAEIASFGYLTNSSASSIYTPLSSPVTSYKNKIINGSMRFWQRGTTFTNPGGAYTADRYMVTQNATSGTYVASRQTASLEGFQYCMRLQRSASQTATGGIFLGHSLESADVIPLQSKPMVFSFYARKGSNFSSVSSDINVQLATGTGTDGQAFAGLTNEVTQISTTAVLTTSWQRFSYTFTAPSNASQLRFNINYTPNGTASTNDYFDITGIQLELGSMLTDFEHKSISTELQMCQRYYQAIEVPIESLVGQYSSPGGGTFYSQAVYFPTTMRTTPSSVTYTNLGAGNYWVIVGNTAVSAASLTGQTFTANTDSLKIQHVRQSGGGTPTVGNTYIWEAGFRLGVNAEL